MQQEIGTCQTKQYASRQGMPIRKDKDCQEEESLHELEQTKKSVHMLNSGTTTLERILEIGKRTKDHGGLEFNRENSGTNSLTEETQKGKDHHHRRTTPLLALRSNYCRKPGNIRKECSHFLMHQKMMQQVQHPETK